ncbi:energy-coupling factor transporter ATPase [Staphylococcus lugdunensis]|uniref:energy-coupling factor transporter ATPase n=1 Tax=Staphylococcus lugdunensis TaxID=28035 RepID=UPI0012489E19|nr:energy-coupling factor transporter ATPase [Staphylococcus lugdunensis]QEX27631.1 energy-coupling factor transporter ATPase [Staphylococcus lugdunensis]QEX37212.1 energy-coupling factor transporter ATPase [Staphylococcus lugdunensis]
MAMEENIIKFKDVSFQYQSDTAFTLDHVSFNIPKGKWTTIVGHNGSGKSTLAKLMVGIEQANEGQIFYNNHLINAQNLQDIRKHIGIVLQNPENQFVGSIVKYDVAFGLENHSVPHDNMHRIVKQVLSDVNMLDYADSEPQSLSGGQKQRVAIAGVLALGPSVIILDEADSMLDPKAREDLFELVKRVQQEKNITIISITHDLTEAMGSDYVIVMNKGTVYQAGIPETIFLSQQGLLDIGLDLPFVMKIAQQLEVSNRYITYEGLVDKL